VKRFDYFYREEFTLAVPCPRKWDVFLSAYDGSKRVDSVFGHVQAGNKLWIVHPEYRIPADKLPDGAPLFHAVGGEAASMVGVVAQLQSLGDISAMQLCVDITGMLRPQIAILTRLLKHKGIRQFDAIYSQPDSYTHREQTRFSSGEVSDVREVTGFAGINSPGAEEFLIVAPGFDEVMLREVFSHKAAAVRYQIFGLPSLQADMYQQNILQAYGIDTPMPTNEGAHRKRFASASDPFAVANELSAIVTEVRQRTRRPRFYVAPLGPKPQMLGSALYYLTESSHLSLSIIYPVVSGHSSGTSTGICRVSINTIDFALVDALSARH
jgi:hypothetical protein